MFGDNNDALAKEERLKFLLLGMLYKFKIAGPKKISFTPQMTLLNQVRLPKYAIRLAVVSLSVDFIVMVPYRDRDTTILP